MINTVRFAAKCVLLISIQAIPCLGEDTEQSAVNDFAASVSALGAMSDYDLNAWLSKVGVDVRRREVLLLKQLKIETYPRNQMALAFLLGLYRTPKAAEPLSGIIALKNPEADLPVGETLLGRYPVVSALVRIGQPAIPAVIRNLETSSVEDVRRLSGRVLYQICGHDLSVALIQKRIDEVGSTDGRDRLLQAIRDLPE